MSSKHMPLFQWKQIIGPHVTVFTSIKWGIDVRESLRFCDLLIFLNKEKINRNQIVNEIVSESRKVWGQKYEIYGK